jgi:flagellar assembly protein FliH
MTLSTRIPTSSPAVFPVIPTPAQAQIHADEKSRGFTQGHAAGYAAGLQLANQELAVDRARQDAGHAERASALEAVHAAEMAALRLAVAAVAERTVPVLADAERALFGGALDLAEALLGQELSDGETSARAALARAYEQGETEIPVAIRMNPADLATLRREDVPASLTVVGDPALNRGDAVAEYPYGFLDARLGTAVARAKAALLESSTLAPTPPDHA